MGHEKLEEDRMTFIDFFAGIGGMRHGLEMAGMECAGYVEIDKFARKSYEAMYDTEGEWTATDIRGVRADEVPKADLWTFGFPCQDISVAGGMKGLKGERSGLFYEITRLLKAKEDKPQWLLVENVKNLISINGGWGFAEVLTELAEVGYDCRWRCVNSRDFGVAQNRERIFIVANSGGAFGRPGGGAGQQVFFDPAAG